MSFQGPNPVDLHIQRYVEALRREFGDAINRTAAGLRKASDERVVAAQKRIDDLHRVLEAVVSQRSGSPPGLQRIEDIAGRRVPFTLLVNIPIGNNTTSVQQGSVTIPQEGPFVAVKQVATFQSLFEFQDTNPSTNAVARFSGRSYGRFRPISSAYDLNDAINNAAVDIGTWYTITNLAGAGDNAPLATAMPALPSSMSGFRTMEFDGLIEVINAGSSYPRQNIPVPSSMWTTQVNSPQELGCLDFFERGEVITFKVQPTHVNNPPVGNANGANIFPDAVNNGFPFVAGQYDPHEGVATPGALLRDTTATNEARIDSIVTERITRLPDGMLTIGFIGYRIVQTQGNPL